MWDPNDRGNWWYQRGSFREPVPPGDADICDPPLVCLSFNTSWAALLARRSHATRTAVHLACRQRRRAYTGAAARHRPGCGDRDRDGLH